MLPVAWHTWHMKRGRGSKKAPKTELGASKGGHEPCLSANMSTPSRARSAVALFWVLVLMPIAACGGSVAVEKTGTPDGKDNKSAGAAGSPANGAGAGANGSSPPSFQGEVPCCNFGFSCDSDDQTLSSSAVCPSGAECYSRMGCCNFVTYCAHWSTVDAGPATVDAGPAMVDAGPADSGACSLLGTWHTHSAPWNNQSTDAQIFFANNGTLSGMPAFVGKWEVVGSELTIHDTVGADMNCSYADRWTLTFSQDCQTAPLLPIGSGCTGARRYLDWDVTLTRD